MKDDKNVYVLKLYDTELLRFSMSYSSSLDPEIRLISTREKLKSLMPIGLELSNEGLLKWLRRRTIPKNRRYVREVLGVLNLNEANVIDIIKWSMGLSLNDSYWVVPARFTGRFADYNLYTNPFSAALGVVALTGQGQIDASDTSSPELTTSGSLPKAWRRENGDLFLYKGATEGFANSGLEPYSEYYISQLASALFQGDTRLYVPYDLKEYKDSVYSTCPIFTNIDTSYVCAGMVYPGGGIINVINEYESLSPSYGDSIRDMILLDALTNNEDRHFGNFGFLRDNHTGKIIGTAPVYDNGYGLFSRATDNDLKDLPSFLSNHPSHYGFLYSDLLDSVITDRQISMLNSVNGFTLTRHPAFNVSAERFSCLQAFLDERIAKFIKFTVKARDFYLTSLKNQIAISTPDVPDKFVDIPAKSSIGFDKCTVNTATLASYENDGYTYVEFSLTEKAEEVFTDVFREYEKHGIYGSLFELKYNKGTKEAVLTLVLNTRDGDFFVSDCFKDGDIRICCNQISDRLPGYVDL